MDVAHTVFHIGVILTLSGPINEGQLKALRSEAAEIWQPYGVEVTWLDDRATDCSWVAPVDSLLRVVADPPEPLEPMSSGPLHPPLGSVRFLNGRPGDTIHL